MNTEVISINVLSSTLLKNFRNAPYQLKIIDTGDYWILHLSVSEAVDRLLMHLYAAMEITLEEHEYKNHNLKEKDYASILNVCSRMVFNEKKSLETLIKDVDGIMNFILIQESYAFNGLKDFYKFQQVSTEEPTEEKNYKPSNFPHSLYTIPLGNKSPLNTLEGFAGYAGKEWFSISNEDEFDLDANLHLNKPLDINGLEPGKTQSFYYQSSFGTHIETLEKPLKPAEEIIFYVIYHKEYHISLLVSKGGLPSTVWNLKHLNHIPEFVWLDTFDFNSFGESSTIEIAKTLFGKKYYETEDAVREKIKAFKVLYNTTASATVEPFYCATEGQILKTNTANKPNYSIVDYLHDGNPPIPKQTEQTSVVNEKRMFERVMAQNFIVDEEPNHRMKASELYKLLCVFMGIPNNNVMNHRRLQSYLIEAGLHKKRYTDGFYYYGIRVKPTTVSAVSSAIAEKSMTLEEYMQIRKDDILKLYPNGLDSVV
jgi:hypothetical protein